MSLFGIGKNESKSGTGIDIETSYGKAWLKIIGQREKASGLSDMKKLSDKGFSEATVVLAMFPDSNLQRKILLKKAADAGNIEAMWEYTDFLPHSRCPNPADANDALWEKYCLQAAEGGSVDAMNEMGNVFHRREHYAESMYWYAMAGYSGRRDAVISYQGIAQEWAHAGCPYSFQRGSGKFDEARHKCAIAFLEMYAGQELSISPDDLVKMALDGVPFAAYLAGDLFERMGNPEMAYKMYNAIAFEKDAHGLKCYADMLVSGRGVAKDMQGALRCYQMAAERGDREAMFIMGEFTKSSDKNKAAYWYGLSHTRGYEASLTRLIQIAQ